MKKLSALLETFHQIKGGFIRKMKTKKKHKYDKWIGDDSYSAICCDNSYYLPETNYLNQGWDNIPSPMQLNTHDSPGLYFGYKTECGSGQYVGLRQGEEGNVLITNICEIADALIPIPHDIKEPFWLESEQSILKAALLYGFHLGLSFRDSIVKIISSTVTDLTKDIITNGDSLSKMVIGETSNLKLETIACIDRELRNKLAVFVTDKFIFNALREESDCFSWNDLNDYNIFLRIPADKIDQWGGVINLMYTQLIRHLERRPEKYSPDGRNNLQTLLIMEEFARFGKLKSITEAMSTLRSKNVNICLIIQSLAQLDKLYGQCDRRIILDNCQYKAILQANDADTQEYFSRLIGTHIHIRRSKSENLDDFMETTGYSNQATEIREPIIFPHELSTLKDILILSPYGFCRADKLQIHNIESSPLFSIPKVVYVEATLVEDEPFDNLNYIYCEAVPLETVEKKKNNE